MTVIYSNFGDEDTKVLKDIWKGLDAKVIEITSDSKNCKDKINKALSEEKDTLIMCGHGTPYGLLSPEYTLCNIIDYSNVRLINAKRVIGVWCHAAQFAEEQNLKGFFTSMFISNPGEARYNNINDNISYEQITKDEIKFCNDLNELIKSDKDISTWPDELRSKVIDMNNVVRFNYNGLRVF